MQFVSRFCANGGSAKRPFGYGRLCGYAHGFVRLRILVLRQSTDLNPTAFRYCLAFATRPKNNGSAVDNSASATCQRRWTVSPARQMMAAAAGSRPCARRRPRSVRRRLLRRGSSWSQRPCPCGNIQKYPDACHISREKSLIPHTIARNSPENFKRSETDPCSGDPLPLCCFGVQPRPCSLPRPRRPRWLLRACPRPRPLESSIRVHGHPGP
jgi:hypothetical protein